MAKGKKGKKSGLNLKIGVVPESGPPKNGLVSITEKSPTHENQHVASDTITEEGENSVIEAINSYCSSEDELDQLGKTEVTENDLVAVKSEDLTGSTLVSETSKTIGQNTDTDASKGEEIIADIPEIDENIQGNILDDEEFGAVTITQEQGVENYDDDDDDDFGSFDEASFEEFEPAIAASNDTQTSFTDLFQDSHITPAKIQRTLDFLFPDLFNDKPPVSDTLLSEQAEAQYRELSRKPRLQPPNWTKLKLRHNLLLKLGIPINLDELVSSSGSGSAKQDGARKKSISESDLDWSKFNIPDIDSLNLTQEAQQELLEKTADILSRIETENMNNTSEIHLQNSLEQDLEIKLAQLKKNYEQLLLLGSIWHERLEDLKGSQNVFESVVQSMVGYNQKIQRNELLESLRRSKTKRGKKMV